MTNYCSKGLPRVGDTDVATAILHMKQAPFVEASHLANIIEVTPPPLLFTLFHNS